MIAIKHNFEREKFVWLWSKYVTGVNDQQHCTNCIKGPYSKKFSKHNESLVPGSEIVFDEQKEYGAVYICGVFKRGYTQKKNYQHNVHLAILPKEGFVDNWEFENWKVEIVNGQISKIVSKEELDEKYKHLEDRFTTCRIFRWAVSNKNIFDCG